MDQLISVQKDFESDIKKATESKERNEVILHISSASKKLLLLQKDIDSALSNNTEIKLSIISDEIVNYLSDFKNRRGLRFEISFSLNKLFDILLNVTYFKYICNLEEKQIIFFINAMIKLIENLRGVLIYQLIIRKAHLYMNYTFQFHKPLRKILNELMKGYYIPHSNQFRTFNERLKNSNIIPLVSSDSSKDKEEGITQLIELISRASFSEQFELLYISGPDVLMNLLKEPSEEYRNAYLKFGNLLCTLCYCYRFNVGIFPNQNDESFKENDNNEDDSSTFHKKKTPNNVTFIFNDKLVENDSELEFLQNKQYELTFQKQILELNEKIIEVCLLYINTVIKFEKIFALQYICYLILRRIYFNFPSYKPEICDNIVLVLSNLCKFTGQFEWIQSLESRQFAYYLLAYDKDLGKKIKSATAIAPNDVRYENFYLKKTNLTIGFSTLVSIEPGKKIEKKIEVLDEESLVYISMGLDDDDDKDIAIRLYKYDSDSTKWNQVYQNDNLKFENGMRKLIIYSKETALYKIIFDNKSSWISKKSLLYRFVFLKPIINKKND